MVVTVAMVSVVNQVHAVVLAIQVHKVLSAPLVFVIHHNAIQSSQLIPRDQVRRAPMKMTMSQRSKLVFPPRSPPQLTLLTLTRRTSHMPTVSTTPLPMMNPFSD